MMTENSHNEIDVLQRIIEELSALDDEAKKRMINTVSIFFKINIGTTNSGLQVIKRTPSDNKNLHGKKDFSQHFGISPKEFMYEKNPRTNTDRMACLGFYLTHYRDMPYFKTLDLSKLSTEAAQQKFTNATQATNDTAKAGIFVIATKGRKQLSAMGEQYVQILPDKEEAKKILKKMKRNRKRKVTKKASRK